jgi:cysteine synthase
MAYYENVVSSVGSTPLIKLSRITAGLLATIALKGEFNNPLGSVKDRIGAAMISAAEEDLLVSAVGTGGTITGVSEVLKSRRPHFRAIAVEPRDSPVITQPHNGEPPKPGPHKIQGTGAGSIRNAVSA